MPKNVITSESQPACSTSPDPSMPSIPIQVDAEYQTPGMAPWGGKAFGTVHSPSIQLKLSPAGACTTAPGQVSDDSGPGTAPAGAWGKRRRLYGLVRERGRLHRTGRLRTRPPRARSLGS